jgi:hypothetical protein
MNCTLCGQHIIATMQVAFNGGNFHADCAVEAVNQKRAENNEDLEIKEALESFDDFEDLTDENFDDLEPDEELEERRVIVPEVVGTNGIPMGFPPGSMLVAPRAIIHPPQNGKHSTLSVGKDAQYVDRNGLMNLPMPQATATHQPIAHVEIVEKLIETLSFRHIQVTGEQYAISKDGMRCFGTLELNNEWDGMTYAIGFKNSNDKSCRLGMTVGMRVHVCSNLMLMGDYTPVFKKHSKSLDLIDTLSIGVDKMQRSFEPMKGRILTWKATKLSVKEGQLLIYRAYLENKFPLQAMKQTHQEFFRPSYEEFEGRSLFSLHNAFTSAFKQLNAMRMYHETARLGTYFQNLN